MLQCIIFSDSVPIHKIIAKAPQAQTDSARDEEAQGKQTAPRPGKVMQQGPRQAGTKVDGMMEAADRVIAECPVLPAVLAFSQRLARDGETARNARMRFCMRELYLHKMGHLRITPQDRPAQKDQTILALVLPVSL